MGSGACPLSLEAVDPARDRAVPRGGRWSRRHGISEPAATWAGLAASRGKCGNLPGALMHPSQPTPGKTATCYGEAAVSRRFMTPNLRRGGSWKGTTRAEWCGSGLYAGEGWEGGATSPYDLGALPLPSIACLPWLLPHLLHLPESTCSPFRSRLAPPHSCPRPPV